MRDDDVVLHAAARGIHIESISIALVFWQPGLACSLDDPLEFLAEGWIVGNF
jgi:hypothetical protein